MRDRKLFWRLLQVVVLDGEDGVLRRRESRFDEPDVARPAVMLAEALQEIPADDLCGIEAGTERRDLASISAPLRPAAPPPTTTTS